MIKQSIVKNLVNKILALGLIISGIIYIIITKNYVFIPSVFIPTFIILIFVRWLIKNKKMNIMHGIYINLALWLNFLGEYYFFYHWIYYDKLLHFFVPLFITIIVYNHLEIKSRHISKKILVFFIVLGVGAGFEVFEYFQSGFFHFPSVGVYADTTLIMPPHQDTIWDLTFNSLGSLIYLLFKKLKKE